MSPTTKMTVINDPNDQRRIEVVAMDLPFAHGLTLACDATITSPIKANGQARPGAANRDGQANADAVKRKHQAYPELVTSEMVRLCVFACEVGGRWGGDAADLIRDLAAHKATTAPQELRTKIRRRWENRWWTMLSVAVQDAVAASLLNDGLFRAELAYECEPAMDDILADCDSQGGPSELEFSRLPAR